MSETTFTLIRMRDAGFALRAANEHGRSLSRIQLQKYIYLMDAIAIVFELLPPTQAHYTFRHGPFDPHIQNAVDALAFRGLAKIERLSQRAGKSVASEYALSAAGARWTTALIAQADFATRSEIAETVGRHVNRLGWHRLVELVYAEPTFVAARPEGFGKRLKPQRGLSASSAQVLQLIRRVLASRKSVPRRDVLATYYFEYLDRYSRTRIARLAEDNLE